VPASAPARRDVHRRAAPAYPRRVSGPARPRTAPAPVVRPTTEAFERLKALPDHRLVDRLLRGRAWIWLIGLLLGGIVAVQVSLLKLNAGISRAVQATGTLQRQNAALESEIARLDSGERIRAAAVKAGMVDPTAGETKYLRARPGLDALRAARRMVPPSATAQSVMANGGHALGATVTAPNLAGPTPTAATTVTTTPTGTTTTAVPAPTPTPTAPTGTTTTGTTGTTTTATTGTAPPSATPVATPTPNQPVG
jgi:cell division protein FtsB